VYGGGQGAEVTPAEVAAFLEGAGREAVAGFLARQRWFAARGRAPRAVELADWAALADAPPLVLALIVADGDCYYLPVAASPGEAGPALDAPAVIAAAGDGVVRDAHAEPEFGRRLLAALAASRTLAGARGRFEARTPGPWPGPDPGQGQRISVEPVGAEQSNTSLRLDKRFILKSIRRPASGPNPEFEVTHFLATRTRFTHTPGLAGWMDHVDARGERATVTVLQPWVEHEGDGWSWARLGLQALAERLSRESRPKGPDRAEVRLRELAPDLAQDLRELGRVTAALHVALASDPSDPDFAPAPITVADVAGWRAAIEADQRRTIALVEAERERWPADAAPALAALVAAGPSLGTRTAALDVLAEAGVQRIRGHGDYHLGQVLRANGSFLVIDFEGEPARPLAERRARHPALRDVAGMLRSFDYAARSVRRERPDGEALAPWFAGWERLARQAFHRGYRAAIGDSAVRLVPPGDQDVRAVSAVFEIEKALYELRYELGYRPDWVGIPLAALSRFVAPS
jgi:trehalose synthase-fused probable maltokinase